MTQSIQIEICYALPDQQKLLQLTFSEGTTAQQAVSKSGIQKMFPEIEMDHLKLAIFSAIIENDYPLKEGDRIEILRPLLADPKEVRKKRAAAGKKMKKAGGK